jgi:L-ascorbate metabolism protein UlaG (beta-lactamase superfamily)
MRVLHLRRRVPLAAAELGRLDGILVSHAHYDHLDPPSLRRLGIEVPVVAPVGIRRVLRSFDDVREVNVGDEVRFGDVSVVATPAEHSSARITIRSTPSLGFVISGSRRIYFAGDTDLFEGMADLAGSLDVALVPVAGWGSKVGVGHLDPERAARALQLLKPRIAVPIHWGTLSLPHRQASPDAAERFRELAEELAPEVEVRVVPPGEALSL